MLFDTGAENRISDEMNKNIPQGKLISQNSGILFADCGRIAVRNSKNDFAICKKGAAAEKETHLPLSRQVCL
ncbi:hypothetical protein [Papillibacter cinnamivorans]|uniref:hypothetical protein n=1 Tax=Papillibacter cinnamivorans TaxID=100176 RepID=UPI00117CC3DB|nr:hypothetical protein [Papillibacter cinnamivorans]